MKPDHPTTRASQQGFTLAEIAIVLVIVGLLLGGLLMPLSAQREAQARSETGRLLTVTQDALLGFVVANGRLPCPATMASNGFESPPGAGGNGNCTNFYDGFVPAATLGLTPVDDNGLLVDEWNRPVRYAVFSGTINGVLNPYTRTNGLKNATMPLVAATTALSVCGSATGATAVDCGTAAKLNDNTPAIVFSTGRPHPTDGTGLDEAANLDGDPVFISHAPSSSAAANGEFDDLVVWLSYNILFNRMVAAGQLP